MKVKRIPGRQRVRGVLARRLRALADLLDPRGALKRTHCSFMFEDGIGIVFYDDPRGCPAWYYGDDDYVKAWQPR